MWLKPHLKKACRVMVARVATASKCREKCKKAEKPILVGESKETPPPYVPLYRISRRCRFLLALDPKLLSLSKTPL
jgi:hypothetical protein